MCEGEIYASACMRRHQTFALAPIPGESVVYEADWAKYFWEILSGYRDEMARVELGKVIVEILRPYHDVGNPDDECALHRTHVKGRERRHRTSQAISSAHECYLISSAHECHLVYRFVSVAKSARERQ
jgi:hypothetical protein